MIHRIFDGAAKKINKMIFQEAGAIDEFFLLPLLLDGDVQSFVRSNSIILSFLHQGETSPRRRREGENKEAPRIGIRKREELEPSVDDDGTIFLSLIETLRISSHTFQVV